MHSITQPVFLNGRFLSQAITGVQRFSTEITTAIGHLVAEGQWPETVVLTPRRRRDHPAVFNCPYQHLQLREVGRARGHIWEQVELPSAAKGGVLVNLGNTAPLLARHRQIVVIHDAAVFDIPDSYSFRFRAWYQILHHGLTRVGAKIVTVSEFSRSRIAARLGIDPGQIAVIYEGADHIMRIRPDPATLERYGLERHRFVLAVSSTVAHKNFELLCGSAAALEQRGMTLAVVGGVDPDVYRTTRGNSPVGRQLGRVSDGELRVLYENAACLVFPSRYEGFGLPPAEAMACNCPVIAGRGGAVEEICGDAALYFDTARDPMIAEAVQQLLDNNTFADDLRARGLTRAAALSWNASARALGKVVQHMDSRAEESPAGAPNTTVGMAI